MSDELQILRIPPPQLGLWDGLDPALSDDEFPLQAASDLENLRVAGGKWETRLGQSLYLQLPGSGDVRFLGNLYTSAGVRYRIAGQGTGTAGKFYKLQQGTDTVFSSPTGGSGLGSATGAYWQGDTLKDRFYFTDRSSALKKYDPSAATPVASVASPVAPTAAPRVKPWTAGVLEDWASLWSTVGSGGNTVAISDVSSSFSVPGVSSKITKIQVTASSSYGAYAHDNVASEALASHSIAFWYRSSSTKAYLSFGFGLTQADEFVTNVRTDEANEWNPQFILMGDLPSINYKRLRCVRDDASHGLLFSKLYLPGRLEGSYRWIYTHYNGATGGESTPSAINDSGRAVDLSTVGKTNDQNTARAFQKSAIMDFTTDAGTDSATNKIRIYRTGGVPSLTKDSRGMDVWCRVGEIYDLETSFTSSPVATATSFTVAAVTVGGVNAIAPGDWLVLEKGTSAKEEYVKVASGYTPGSTTITLDATTPLVYGHSSGTSQKVQIAFLDNVPNEAVDATQVIDRERNDPPAAAKFVARSPEGRLWLFGYTGKPTGIAVSNRATPDHPSDYEVFPDAVDPLTRRSLIQGFRFQIGGDLNEDQIQWGGFFHGLPTVLTHKSLYLIQASSQADWSPTAIQRLAGVGCLAPDAVCEVGGALYWVTTGPQIVRWDGQSAPQVISDRRVTTLLKAASSTYWANWFAVGHTRRDGQYYCLYLTPSGESTNVLRLDYNITRDTWEPVIYYRDRLMNNNDRIGWQGATVLDAGSDLKELYQGATDGRIYQAETGNNDDGSSIRVRGTTKRVPLGVIGLVHEVYVRLAATTDTITMTVTSGGSEYGDVSHSYTLTPSGSGDKEVKVRVHRDLKGRWVQLSFSGSVSNAPAIREIVVHWTPDRMGRYSA